MKKLNIQLLIIATIALVFFHFGCKSDKFSLKIFGDQEAIGAGVYVNGKYSGTLQKFADTGSYYSEWLPYGTYKIEIKKEGYTPFHEDVTVKPNDSEYYMNVAFSSAKEDKKAK
jgi:hypothetical protein